MRMGFCMRTEFIAISKLQIGYFQNLWLFIILPEQWPHPASLLVCPYLGLEPEPYT